MAATTEKTTGDQLPDVKILDEAGDLMVKDANGKDVAFSSFYKDKPANERQLIVFIRHFFCGACEEYVRALAKDLPPSKLAETSTTLTIIGCGDPVCIPDYIARTTCPFDIYADPQRQLYKKLDMVVALKGPSKRPEYLTKSLFSIVGSSLVNAVTSGSQMVKGGPASQNGGELLFQNGQLTFFHRMRNTADHLEVKELSEVLGV